MLAVIKRHINPKNKKRVLGLGSLLVIYSVLGFLLAPMLVTQLAKDYVQQQLNLQLSVANIEINPLTLSIKLQDVDVKQNDGELLLSVADVYLNASLILSAWQQQIYLQELDVIQPYINAKISQTGILNLLQLIPPDDKSQATDIAWQLAVLAVHNAQIDFSDESSQQPFKKQLKAINLQLLNISSFINHQGRYQFVAQTAEHETLKWQGTIGLNPIRSQGHFAVKNVQLNKPANYLSKDLAFNIQQGVIDVAADYVFQFKNQQAQMQLTQGNVLLHQVLASTKTVKPLDFQLKKAELRQLNAQWPQAKASFAQLVLEQPRLQQQQRDILAIDQIILNQTAWQQSNNRLNLNHFKAQNMVLNGQHGLLLQLPQLDIERFIMDDAHLNTGRVLLMGGQTSLQRGKQGQINWQDELKQLNAQLETLSSPSVSSTSAPTRTYQ